MAGTIPGTYSTAMWSMGVAYWWYPVVPGGTEDGVLGYVVYSEEETRACQDAPGRLTAGPRAAPPASRLPPARPANGQRFAERFRVDGIRSWPHPRSRYGKNPEPIQCFRR